MTDESTPIDDLPSDKIVDLNEEGGSFYREIGRLAEKTSSWEDFCYLVESEKGPMMTTERFLETCLRLGMDIVSIKIRTNLIKASVCYPFAPFKSVFSRLYPFHGRELIWSAVEETEGISKSCGNSGQAQLVYPDFLISGVYIYRDEKWQNWIGD